MVFCTQCGQQLEDNHIYCYKCGTKKIVSKPAETCDYCLKPLKFAQARYGFHCSKTCYYDDHE